MPAGLPSELLDRRPDIREAEQTLAAATAQHRRGQGAALPAHRAHRLLRLREHRVRRRCSTAPRKSWNISGNLLQPIFNAGKNRRRVEITESRQRQALYAYERTILQAFREIEDALVGLPQDRASSARRRPSA